MTEPGSRPATTWSRRRDLVAVWATTAALLGLLLVVANAAGSPLDDRDLAYQRPGFLDEGSLPDRAPPVSDRVPTRGRRAVIFFERVRRVEGLCDAIRDHGQIDDADIAVVTESSSSDCGRAATVIVDETGALARRYGLREPRDDGYPIGYAVVDSEGRIRYRTLDPTAADHLAEVATIVEATP